MPSSCGSLPCADPPGPSRPVPCRAALRCPALRHSAPHSSKQHRKQKQKQAQSTELLWPYHGGSFCRPKPVRPPFFWRFFFGACQTVNAEGWIESEAGVQKISVRRVVRHLQIGTGPRRSPSACSEIVGSWRFMRTLLFMYFVRAHTCAGHEVCPIMRVIACTHVRAILQHACVACLGRAGQLSRPKYTQLRPVLRVHSEDFLKKLFGACRWRTPTAGSNRRAASDRSR